MYDSIQRLNLELTVLGSRLANMRSVGVYHLGPEVPIGCQRLPDHSWLNVTGNPPLAIGLFETEAGERHVLVTNRNCEQTETTTLTFPPNVAALFLTDSATGQVKKLRFRESECQVTIPAGTGLLFSLR